MSQTVRKRRVLYIPGYDPFPPRRYRELYRSEGRAQAAISGYALKMAPMQGGERFGWRVSLTENGITTEAQVEVLVWSDLVQCSMGASIPATYGQLLRTAWTYIGSGALFRLMRMRAGPVIAALYPVVFLLVQLALAVGLGWGAFKVTQNLPIPGVTVFSSVLGILTGWAVLETFRRFDGKLYAYYLMHDYAYSAQFRGADPPDLGERMQRFAATIRDTLHEDWDEVLIVGHSSGAHLGVSILAELARDGTLAAAKPVVGFLSLGQVVPMVSFLPKANKLRCDLQLLSTCEDITWVDVTAPGDGCSFALCDPVAVSGVAPKGKRWPLVISAAFTQTLSPKRWKELKRRYFRLHFQYLCAFDQPGDYDYFRITAGAQTLDDRFKDRQPSPSRITRPVNRFTST